MVLEDLEKFLSKNVFTIENIENYFSLEIGIVSKFNVRPKSYTCQISKSPKSFQNCLFFEDIRNDKAYKNSKDLEAGVFLLMNIDLPKLRDCFRPLLNLTNFSDGLFFYGIDASGFEPLTMKRLRYLESKYKVNIVLYENCKESNTTITVRETLRKKFEITLPLLVPEGASRKISASIEQFSIILSKALFPKEFVCDVHKKCRKKFRDIYNLERHRKICLEMSTKKIICKEKTQSRKEFRQDHLTFEFVKIFFQFINSSVLQVWLKICNSYKAYGDNSSKAKEIVEDGFAPEEFINFRDFFLAVWDIETFEEKTYLPPVEHGMVAEADLKLLSIGLGSNLPGFKPKCWVRKSSDPDAADEIIKQFVHELFRLQKQRRALLPDYVKDIRRKIFEKEDQLMRESEQNGTDHKIELSKLASYLNYMKNMESLSIFGFNSQKFDLPVIAGPLFRFLSIFGEISVLKKGTAYFTVSCEGLVFKDCLNYTAPCSLDKFLKNWEAPAEKTIWPYSLFSSVEEIKMAKHFPKRAEFFSDLKSQTVSIEDYVKAATEYHRRRLLPKNHPDKIFSMEGWLKHYNIVDVQPLAQALENCFRCYSIYFDVDPLSSHSLPGMAQQAMMKNFSPHSPLFYSIPNRFKEVNELFRSNVIGGLVNVYSRHASTDPDPNLPFRVNHTANGDPMKVKV